MSVKNDPNLTMPMFISGSGSPVAGNAHVTPNFIKRPVSAVMTKRLSPHSSVDLPIFDLNRMRPRKINKDKQSLYDDVLKLKKNEQFIKDENLRLKTNLHKLESECNRKEKLLEEILLSQNNLGKSQISKIKAETQFSVAMRRHLREVKQEMQFKDDEITRLKKNIRSTRYHEMETEIKMYIEEWNRLRALAKDIIVSKDPLMDPKQRSEIDKKFMEQNMIIEQLRSENSELEDAYLKCRENEQLNAAPIAEEAKQPSKSQRRETSVKERRRQKRLLKAKTSEISKLK